MNWITMLQGLFKLLPYVVAGVETIHANENSETKTQLAQDAMGIATQAATQVLGTNNAAIATAVNGAVNNGIAQVQNVIATIKGVQAK